MTLTVGVRTSHEWDPKAPASLVSYTGTDPALGVEVSETVPAGKTWQVLAIRVTYAVSGTAGARFVTFTIDDGTTQLYRITPHTGSLGTNTQNNFSLIAGIPWGGADPGNSSFLFGLPNPLLMGPGYRFKSLVTNLAVDDNWNAPAFTVLEWTI